MACGERLVVLAVAQRAVQRASPQQTRVGIGRRSGWPRWARSGCLWSVQRSGNSYRNDKMSLVLLET